MHEKDVAGNPGRPTGPRSNAGKETSSRNSTTHGLACGTFFLLPGESEEEYNALAQQWRDEYAVLPESPALASLLDTLIKADWVQKRAFNSYCKSETALAMAEISHASQEEITEIFKRLQLTLRYKTSLENSFQRAFRAIEAFRKSRIAERLTHARTLNAVHQFIAKQADIVTGLIKHCAFTPDQAHEHVARISEGVYRIASHIHLAFTPDPAS